MEPYPQQQFLTWCNLQVQRIVNGVFSTREAHLQRAAAVQNRIKIKRIALFKSFSGIVFTYQQAFKERDTALDVAPLLEFCKRGVFKGLGSGLFRLHEGKQ